MARKYCVLIMDGAAGWPIKEMGDKTTLELARTPNLDRMVRQGRLGLTHNVPPGLEPSSAIACMSLLGYDPEVYYKGRAAIEAVSQGVKVGRGEQIFRANLVAARRGRMWSYCSGHIRDEEARELIAALNERLGNTSVRLYPGVGYRHLLKLSGHPDTTRAVCTPPHDIPDQPIAANLPRGQGSRFLAKLMADSEAVLRDHPVNLRRVARGEIPATMLWLFWGSGPIPPTPPFRTVYGLSAALTSAVDLLRGLGLMMGMDILEFPHVTDNMQNDFAGQMAGGLAALREHDLVVVHVEAPDEAGHAGNAKEKVEAIERIDSLMLNQLGSISNLRVLVLPDHPTPVPARTHVAEPVPFLLWGPGFAPNGGARFTETEARKTGAVVAKGYNMMRGFTGKPEHAAT